MADESKLSVEVTEQKSISTVHFSGTYGPLSVILMKEMVNALVRNHRLKLILQFDHIESLNEEAYRYLEEVHKRVDTLGGAVVLVCQLEQPGHICGELEKRYAFLVFPDFEQARDYFIGREF